MPDFSLLVLNVVYHRLVMERCEHETMNKRMHIFYGIILARIRMPSFFSVKFHIFAFKWLGLGLELGLGRVRVRVSVRVRVRVRI